MAVYKVPQDVEAEDKLIGPFSFRQFIYLIIAALSGFLVYLLGQIFIALGLIPLPITIFFLAVALPLKKDQPMETYLTAIVQFLLKPRKRLWEPEGNVTLVEITASQVDDGPALKDFSGHEASERLRYLSQIVDTGGWASRGLTSPLDSLNLNDTVIAEAQGTEDMLDVSGSITQNFNAMISRSDEAHRQAMRQTMQNSIQAAAQPVPQTLVPSQQLYGYNAPSPLAPNIPVLSYQQALADQSVQMTQAQSPRQTQAARPTPQATYPMATSAPQIAPDEQVVFNPYPSSIHQRVISPASAKDQVAASPQTSVVQNLPEEQAQAPSKETLSPDIMRLASSKDLSISTIAREAERLQKKHLEEGEVVVSLR